MKKHADAAARDRVDVLLVDQCRCWRSGDPRPVERYLQEYSEIAAAPEFKMDLVYGEVRLELESGHRPDLERLFGRFPDLPRP